MIGVRPELAPSALLFDEQVSQIVRALLRESRASRQKREWMQSERRALDARAVCRETGDHVGLALARIHLADFYGDVGELGLAIEQCEEAYQILERQPARAQRHNEAVAAYALGILHELQLSGAVQSLSWYHKAIQQFERAQEHWATLNAPSQVRACASVRREINQRSDRIIGGSRANPDTQRAVFTIWRSDSTDAPFTDQNGLQGYVIGDDRVLINGTPYHPKPAINIEEANYCFALPVPKGKWAIPGAQIGDYVFVRQQWQVDEERKMGVVWEPGSGWVAVGFRRGSDGQINLHPLHPKVIDSAEAMPGDPVGKVKGYIIGLLKPER